MTADTYKRRAAQEAVALVESGMTLGLGTGSTAAHFVDLVGEKARAGLAVRGVATSEETARRAREASIALFEPDETTVIDLAVDGTDETDRGCNLIKGGGGALLREKIVAAAARRFVVIADASKKVGALGAFPLPVEIDRFAFALTVKRVREILTRRGFDGRLALRPDRKGSPFLSDGGHFILDCALGRIAEPARLEAALKAIPGVVETGLFVGMAERVILAGPDGVETLFPQK